MTKLFRLAITVGLLLALGGCMAEVNRQLQTSIIAKPQTIYRQNTQSGLFEIQKGVLTGTEFVVVNDLAIDISGYSNIRPIMKIETVRSPSGYTTLLATAATPTCKDATIAIFFDRRDYTIQEMPGCGVEYDLEQFRNAQGRNIVSIVGRTADETARYAVVDFGKVVEREVTANAAAPTPTLAPTPTPETSRTARLPQTTPQQAPRTDAARPTPGERTRTANRPAAAPESEPAPEPAATPRRRTRTVFTDLPPARSGELGKGTEKGTYDPAKEKS